MITNTARSTPTTAPTMAPMFDECSSLGDLSEKVNLQLNYSGTSDKGPSEIGTTSLQRTLAHANTLVWSLIGTTSYTWDKIIGPIGSPLFEGSTVYCKHSVLLCRDCTTKESSPSSYPRQPLSWLIHCLRWDAVLLVWVWPREALYFVVRAINCLMCTCLVAIHALQMLHYFITGGYETNRQLLWMHTTH